MLYDVPYREISLIRNNDRDYYFSFEDLNSPVAPIFNQTPDGGVSGLSQRKLYDFPVDTQFLFSAKDDLVNINKTGIYDSTTKEVKISFTAADTSTITQDRRVYFEMDAVFPSPDAGVTPGPRYTILAGYVIIFATRKLNV